MSDTVASATESWFRMSEPHIVAPISAHPGRRRVLLTGGAAVLLRGVQGRAAPRPARVYPAAAFVESVGVNVHLSSDPYRSRRDMFEARLAALGVRHLRDELRPGDDIAGWRRLHNRLGVRAHLLVSPATNTPDEMMRYLEALGIEAVSAIEGQNEGDSPWFEGQGQARPDWATAVCRYQREIHRALRANPATAHLKLLSPSVLDYRPQDMAAIAASASFCDIVAVHAYPQHAEEPETPDPYAAIGWYEDHMVRPYKPGAPWMVTETGYCNVVRPGSAGISERAAARYLPRLLLTNFRAGVTRSFLYEFMDESADPQDGEGRYGLVRVDGTPKPAFHVLRRLLAALRDDATPTVAADVSFTSASGPDDLETMSFAAAGGATILAIWRRARAWDPDTARDVTVPGAAVRVAVGTALARAEHQVIQDEGTWTRDDIRDGVVGLTIDDRVTLLKLHPAGTRT